MNALIVARTTSPPWDVLHLLARAGFQTDVVTTAPLLRLSRFARSVNVVPLDALVGAACERMRAQAYDWVMAADDLALRDLIGAEWPEGKEPRFLPSATKQCLAHICSKIGLSRVLAEGGVRTPPFRVAYSAKKAARYARDIGYPVLVKVDFSGGGAGVHECHSDADVAALEHVFGGEPLLIQKEIEGTELDLSAIYFEGDLVHFAYSVVNRTMRRFGLSSVRTVHPVATVDGQVFAELERLGRVLAASGFVTITCIDAADGSGRYYVEADMRANAWPDYSRHIGDDAAPRIRAWFGNRSRLTKKDALGDGARRAPLTIPYFMRLELWELLVNRYGVWKFIPYAEGRLVRRLLLNKFIGDAYELSRRVKWLLPRNARAALRNVLISCHLLPE